MPQHALAILLGALIAFYGNELPDRYWSAYAPMLLLLCRYCPVYRFVLLLFASWLWSAAFFHYHLDHRLGGDFDNRIVLLRGVVTEIPAVGPGRIRLYLDISEIDGYTDTLPRLARLGWYQDKIVPQSGETWQFEAKIRQPRATLNPDGFDFEKWQFSRGIDVAGYIRDSPLNRRLRVASRLAIDHWRLRLSMAIDAACADCPRRGLIKALALGYRGDINNADKQMLQQSGTAHLLAISGLHIGMVSLLAFTLGRFGWRLGIYRTAVNRNQFAALVAICAASVYAGLAGFSLPTVRALIMLLVLLFALLLKSRVNLLQSLSLAVATILLLDPRSVGSNSFWLSLCAMLIIGFANFRLPAGYGWWRSVLFVQACFSLLLAPLGAMIFGQLNPAGFAANIIAIPLIGFVVLPLILLACGLAACGFEAARPFFTISDLSLGYLLDYLELLLNSGLGSIAADYPAPLLLLSLAALTWLLMPRLPFARGAALIALALVVAWQPQRPEDGEIDAIVFDVGMGTSVLLRTRRHSLVYDFGPGRAGAYSAADQALLPAMRRYAIGIPDLVVVSHVDQDHSGGLHSFLEKYPDTRLLSGTPRELRARFAPPGGVRSCHDYPAWRWDGVKFRFLSADSDAVGTNNRSCVLLIEGHHRLLLSGDIEYPRESRLVSDYGETLAADVLLAPHHGSGTSSSLPFVNRVAPDYVIFTVSRANRWGFPADEVSARYAALGTRVLRSDFDGAIGLRSESAGLSISLARRPLRRIWRRW